MKLRITQAISILVLLLWPSWAAAQNYTIAPTPFQTALDNSGHIINNACIWTYQAGTTTAATTYLDTAGTPNLNPIRSDSAGRFTTYLLAGSNYKFVYESSCTPPAHGTTLRTADNIAGVPPAATNIDVPNQVAGEALTAGQVVYLSDGSGGKIAGQWYKADNTNTYSSTLPPIGMVPISIAASGTGLIRTAGYMTGLSSLVIGTPYYVGSAGALSATGPANRRVVGVADSATSLILDKLATPLFGSGTPSNSTFLRGDYSWSTAWTVITTTSTGTQNDFSLALVGNTVVRCNNATLLSISGFNSPSGAYDGQHVKFVSIGAGQVDVLHQSTNSSAANRMINIATSGVTSAAAGSGEIEYVYDATTVRWRLFSHEQGAWIAYVPTTYTGNGAMTFATVTTTVMRYKLRGREMTIAWDVTGTVGGTPNTQISFTLPSTFATTTNAYGTYDMNVTVMSLCQSSGSTIVFFVDATAASNWTAGSRRLIGTFTFEVN